MDATAGGPFILTVSVGGQSANAPITVSNSVPPKIVLNSPADGATFPSLTAVHLQATVTPGTKGKRAIIK